MSSSYILIINAISEECFRQIFCIQSLFTLSFPLLLAPWGVGSCLFLYLFLALVPKNLMILVCGFVSVSSVNSGFCLFQCQLHAFSLLLFCVMLWNSVLWFLSALLLCLWFLFYLLCFLMIWVSYPFHEEYHRSFDWDYIKSMNHWLYMDIVCLFMNIRGLSISLYLLQFCFHHSAIFLE